MLEVTQLERTVNHSLARASRRRRHIKQTAAKWTSLSVVALVILFVVLYLISKWFDHNQLVFQQPIFVKLQSILLIQKRLALAPIPKAQYADVDPLTKPSNIDTIVKEHTSFNPIETATVDPVSRETIRTLIHNKVVQRFGEAAWPQIDYIITHESNYDPYIVNKSSGACGIFQALPCSKLPSLDIVDQINWGLNVYIPGRYHTAQAAYDFKVANGWY